LIPFYTLTFSTRDSVTLEWPEFCNLLREPKSFSDYWRKKQKSISSKQEPLGLEG